MCARKGRRQWLEALHELGGRLFQYWWIRARRQALFAGGERQASRLLGAYRNMLDAGVSGRITGFCGSEGSLEVAYFCLLTLKVLMVCLTSCRGWLPHWRAFPWLQASKAGVIRPRGASPGQLLKDKGVGC